jgi:hypothetical protein
MTFAVAAQMFSTLDTCFGWDLTSYSSEELIFQNVKRF